MYQARSVARLSRRALVGQAVLGAGALLLAACGQAATPTPAPATSAAPAPPAPKPAEPTQAAVTPAAKTAEPTKPAAAPATKPVESTKPAATPAAAKPAKQFKKTQITVPSWWAPHEVKGAEAAFAQHFTPQTGITVKYEYIQGSDFDQKVFTRIAANQPYDVLTFNADRVPQYLARAVLQPLDDLIKGDSYDLSDFYDVGLDQWKHDGKLYGLANDMGSFHVYVNHDLFKKAGVTPPTPTQDWTFSDLFEAAKKIHTAQGDNVEVWGFGTNLNRDIWANLNGAYLFDEKLTKCLADDPAVVESFQFAQDLINKHKIALRPGSVKIGNNELFLSGKLGIMLDGTWQVGYLRDKKPTINWDVAMLPKGPKASSVIVPNFTAGWLLPKGVEDQDASWEALKFYASKTFAEDVMFVTLSSLPTRKSALEGGKFAQWPKNPPQGLTPAFYKKMLDQGAAYRHIKFDIGSKIIASLNKTSLIFSGERPAPDVLKEIATEVNAELPNRPWLKR